MITQILEQGNPVSPESEAWLRAKMKSRSRYKNLEPTIYKFTIERYTSTAGGFRRSHMMVMAWKHGVAKPIPLPKKELASSPSKKSRVLSNLRKVIDYQLAPLRVKGLHVDHIYPFEAIATDWLTLNGLSWDKVTSRHYPSFDAYHAKVAQYQLLTPKENISKSNKVHPNASN